MLTSLEGETLSNLDPGGNWGISRFESRFPRLGLNRAFPAITGRVGATLKNRDPGASRFGIALAYVRAVGLLACLTGILDGKSPSIYKEILEEKIKRRDCMGVRRGRARGGPWGVVNGTERKF